MIDIELSCHSSICRIIHASSLADSKKHSLLVGLTNVDLLVFVLADLPPGRVTSDKPPFTFVGIDCLGPFLVKSGRSLVKRYGVIFTDHLVIQI